MDDKNLVFKFTKAGADLMIAGLGKLSFEISAALITDLQNQFQEQTVKPKEEKPITEKLKKS